MPCFELPHHGVYTGPLIPFGLTVAPMNTLKLSGGESGEVVQFQLDGGALPSLTPEDEVALSELPIDLSDCPELPASFFAKTARQ